MIKKLGCFSISFTSDSLTFSPPLKQSIVLNTSSPVNKKHPNADRLLVFQIDVGEDKPRQIISSIAEFYRPEDVIGKRVVVVTNLKKAKFRGMDSDGMLVCASLPNDEDVELLTITKDFPGGTKVD